MKSRANFEIGRISKCLYLVLLCSLSSAFAQTQEPPSLQFARPQGPAAPPAVITLQDALDRAKQVDAQYQLAIADAAVAREDRIQSRLAMFPTASHTTQYLGTQGNGGSGGNISDVNFGLTLTNTTTVTATRAGTNSITQTVYFQVTEWY